MSQVDFNIFFLFSVKLKRKLPDLHLLRAGQNFAYAMYVLYTSSAPNNLT